MQQKMPRGRKKKVRTEPIRPICPQCEKQFSNQSALTKHKLTHSDERKFACNQCSKAFKRHDHLTGHMQTHSQRKPFNCTIQGCDKTYCDARSLRRHMENIHHIVAPKDNSSNSNHNSINNNLHQHQHQHPHHHQQPQQSQIKIPNSSSLSNGLVEINGQQNGRYPPPLDVVTHQQQNHQHHHQQHHHDNQHHQQHYNSHSVTSYSAGYASTQHFSFDFDQTNNNLNNGQGASQQVQNKSVHSNDIVLNSTASNVDLNNNQIYSDSGANLHPLTPTNTTTTNNNGTLVNRQHYTNSAITPTNNHSIQNINTTYRHESSEQTTANRYPIDNTHQPQQVLTQHHQDNNNQHHYNNHPATSYSAGYASTQQFSFDFDSTSLNNQNSQQVHKSLHTNEIVVSPTSSNVDLNNNNQLYGDHGTNLHPLTPTANNTTNGTLVNQQQHYTNSPITPTNNHQPSIQATTYQQPQQQHHHQQQQQPLILPPTNNFTHPPQQHQLNQQPSTLYTRRVQRLNSDGGVYASTAGPVQMVGQLELRNRAHHNISDHQVSYSADYASSQHFSFEFNQINHNNVVPHSANSIADSGLGLNVHYEQQQQLEALTTASGNNNHYN